MLKIIIDPGHGTNNGIGGDPGAVGNGFKESERVLKVGLFLRDMLIQDGRFHVKMTRETEVFVDLSSRAKISNSFGADLFISIHLNSSTSTSATGSEVLTYDNTGLGFTVGKKLLEILNKEEGLVNRGCKSTGSNFAVIRETAAPAIITESCFISNPSDIAKFNEDEELRKLAWYHYRAIAFGFGYNVKIQLQKTTPVSTRMPTPTMDWGTAEINKLKTRGIINGDHKPNNQVTWAEFAAVINTILDKMK